MFLADALIHKTVGSHKMAMLLANLCSGRGHHGTREWPDFSVVCRRAREAKYVLFFQD